MGFIMSPEDAIKQLRFKKPPYRPIKCERVVSQGDHIFIHVGGNDVIIARKMVSTMQFAYIPSSKSYWMECALRAFVKLKLIDKPTLERHLEVVKQHDDEAAKQSDMKSIERIAEKHGLKIPASWAKTMLPKKKKK